MKIQWNRATWYSKLIAAIVFVLTFFIGYSLGILTQKTTDDYRFLPSVFIPTGQHPTPTPTRVSSRIVGPGERCGGNMMNPPVCRTGYHCAPAPGSHLPLGDVGGTCISD